MSSASHALSSTWNCSPSRRLPRPKFSLRAGVIYLASRAPIPGKTRRAYRRPRISRARVEVPVGIGSRFLPSIPQGTREPMPIIGVRDAPMQSGVHDDAPRYDLSRSGRPLLARGRARAANRVFSQGPPEGVDSRTPDPKRRCDRHRTGPHPSGIPWTPGGQVGPTVGVHCRRRLPIRRGRNCCFRPLPSRRHPPPGRCRA
jgi:hypothetical protein